MTRIREEEVVVLRVEMVEIVGSKGNASGSRLLLIVTACYSEVI